MAALFQLIPVDDVSVGALSPGAGWAEDFFGEEAAASGQGGGAGFLQDGLAEAFPVKPG